MDIGKHMEFFNPTNIEEQFHIIGCGAVGSTIIETLTRTGIKEMHIYDFDFVTPHNVTNQMFRAKDFTRPKVDAIEEICKEINPKLIIHKHPEGYTNQELRGYVFLCADDMKVRKKVAEDNQFNGMIKAMTDFRMGLADGQHYFINWAQPKEIQAFIDGASFDAKDAEQNAPTNACGLALNIISTVRTISSLGITNWMNFHKNGKYHKMILVNVLDSAIMTM